MKLSIVAGATGQSVNVFIQNSARTDGAGLPGLVFNSAGLSAYYSFSGANAGSVQIPLVTLATLGTAWAAGGFKEIDAVGLTGVYRFDLPNAALAAGKGRAVTLVLGGAPNMAPCPIEIELTGWDNQDGTRAGLTALPPVPCTGNASLLTSGAGADQLAVSAGKVLLQAAQPGVTIPTVTTVSTPVTAGTVTDKSGYSLISTGLDTCIVAGKTLLQAVRYIGAAVAGQYAGAQTGTETAYDFAAVAAITYTMDSLGNCSATVYH